ncbi:MAG: hypothetical protein CL610_12810 [Anaerolineaceae bacterium]|nr:hypothetical protein [Anaerolineaceae bacterium]
MKSCRRLRLSMNERDAIRLRHMLDESYKVQQFLDGQTRSALDTNDLLAYAVRYALQIIGEAAAQVSTETRNQYPQIQWKDIVGMRQWLVHGYERVENDIIWNTIHDDMPPLIEQLETILSPPDADA